MRLTRIRHPRTLAATLMSLGVAGFAVAQQAMPQAGSLEGHTEPVYSVAWSPDGKHLVTGGFDNTVRVWDAATRKEIKKLEGHSAFVLNVGFDKDGRKIVSGGLDKTARIWELPSEAPTRALTDHAAPIRAFALKPDGKAAAVASGKDLKVWDLATGKVAKSVASPGGELQTLAWKPDGSQIATGDKGKTLRLWNPPTGRPREPSKPPPTPSSVSPISRAVSRW